MDVSGLGIAVVSLARATHNKCIVKVMSEDDSRRLVDAVSISEVLTASVSSLKRPRVVLKGIEENFDGEQLITALRYQNAFIRTSPNDSFRVVFKTKGRIQGKSNYILEVESSLYHQMVEVGGLNVGFQRVRVQPCSSVVHCTKCLGYGHTGHTCKEAFACRGCGGDHKIAECPKKGKLTCVNCVRKNRRLHLTAPTGHSPLSRACILHRQQEAKSTSATDFGNQ